MGSRDRKVRGVSFHPSRTLRINSYWGENTREEKGRRTLIVHVVRTKRMKIMPLLVPEHKRKKVVGREMGKMELGKKEIEHEIGGGETKSGRTEDV